MPRTLKMCVVWRMSDSQWSICPPIHSRLLEIRSVDRPIMDVPCPRRIGQHLAHLCQRRRMLSDHFDIAGAPFVVARAKAPRLRTFGAKIIRPKRQRRLPGPHIGAIRVSVEPAAVAPYLLQFSGLDAQALGCRQQATVAKSMKNIIPDQRQVKDRLMKPGSPARKAAVHRIAYPLKIDVERIGGVVDGKDEALGTNTKEPIALRQERQRQDRGHAPHSAGRRPSTAPRSGKPSNPPQQSPADNPSS